MKKGTVINIACATILILLSVILYYYSYKTSSSVYLYAGVACTFFALILFYSKLLPDNFFKKEFEYKDEDFEAANIIEIDDDDKPIEMTKCSDEVKEIVKKSLLLQLRYKEEKNLDDFVIRVRCTPANKSFNIEDDNINADQIDSTMNEIFSKENDRVFNEFDIYCNKACKVSIYVNGHITVDYNNNDKETKELADKIKEELKKITNKSVVIGTYVYNTKKKASK